MCHIRLTNPFMHSPQASRRCVQVFVSIEENAPANQVRKLNKIKKRQNNNLFWTI
jgi:hypothetical protein